MQLGENFHGPRAMAAAVAAGAGDLVIPDRPGAGIDWNEDAVARCRLEV